MRASRDDHVEAHRQQEVRRWTSVLGAVHTGVLGQLGLAHTDPEHCFGEGSGRTVARCCSVGEHVAECWPRELSGIGGQARPHWSRSHGKVLREGWRTCAVGREGGRTAWERLAKKACSRRFDPCCCGVVARPNGCEVGKHFEWRGRRPSVRATGLERAGEKHRNTAARAPGEDGHRLGVPRRRARHPAWAGSWERDLSGARFFATLPSLTYLRCVRF